MHRCSLLVTFSLLAALCTVLAVAHPSPAASSSSSEAEDGGGSVSSSSDPGLPPDTFRKLAQALYQRSSAGGGFDRSSPDFGGESSSSSSSGDSLMRRKLFYNHEVTCNDGSVAGYYIRRNFASRRWVIFLEGGWICHDEQSCGERASRERHRMSSDHWPSVRAAPSSSSSSNGGILSPDPRANPHLSSANHVFVPYCSSDSWSGTRRSSGRGSPSFQGSAIVRQVVAELADFEQLLAADEVFLAGSSAGATGVLVNVDAVAEMLSPAGVPVRGIVDSGWFVDGGEDDCDGRAEATQSSTISKMSRCSVIRDLQKGVEMWDAKVPEACRAEYPTQPWKCFFGYRIYPLIKAPLFIFQWQFDTFQLFADNMALSSSSRSSSGDRWERISSVGASLRRSLSNVTAVFSPACIAHEALTKSSWTEVRVGGRSLPDAIECWSASLPGRTNAHAQSPDSSSALEVRRSPLAAEVPHATLRRQANDIVVPVRIHSRTASMLSDPRGSYKLASNLVRSMGGGGSSGGGHGGGQVHLMQDPYRNSINGHRMWRKNRRRTSAYNNSSRNNRTYHSSRRHHSRHGGGKRGGGGRRGQVQNGSRCHPASNSCEEQQQQPMYRNGDYVKNLKSVGRRSSTREAERRKEEKRERRRRKRNRRNRKNRRRKQKQKKLEKKNGGSAEELKDEGTVEESSRRDKRNKDVDGDSKRKKAKLTKEERRRRRRERKRRKKEKRRRRERRRRKELARALSQVKMDDESSSSSSEGRRRRDLHSQSTLQCGISSSSEMRLVDSCSWPHCNPTCPMLQNPETGQEVDFLALLESFGLDLRAVARELGVDPAELAAMDRGALLRRLTSHSPSH